jgi:hypothetical protein
MLKERRRGRKRRRPVRRRRRVKAPKMFGLEGSSP